MASKYEALDDAILEKIGEYSTPIMFSDVLVGFILIKCRAIAKNQLHGETYRILDRRLQALRKAGKIKHIPGKGWVKL